MPKLDQTAGTERRNARLAGDLIAWLGTTRPDGRPHVVPVWFVWDRETLLVLSQPETQKVRNLGANPLVTLALDDTRQGKDVVIVDGVASTSSKSPPTRLLDAYIAKYAGVLAEMEWSPEAYLAEYTQAILIRPTRFLDW